MHSVSPTLRRSSSAIRSSILDVHVAERRDQFAAGGRLVRRQLGELCADLVERQPDVLCEDDERDPPEYRPRVATMAQAFALGVDQATLLVEAERRRGNAASA